MTSPIPRPAARVLLIDASERILLIQHRDDDDPFIWVPPGGALEPGESPEAAALRELKEEVGLEGVALGPCVWLRSHVFHLFGTLFDGREHYYVCHVEAHEVGDHVNEDEIERQHVVGHRWWSHAEIAASNETFVPRRLASLLPPILRGDYPNEPFEVGV